MGGGRAVAARVARRERADWCGAGERESKRRSGCRLRILTRTVSRPWLSPPGLKPLCGTNW